MKHFKGLKIKLVVYLKIKEIVLWKWVKRLCHVHKPVWLGWTKVATRLCKCILRLKLCALVVLVWVCVTIDTKIETRLLRVVFWAATNQKVEGCRTTKVFLIQNSLLFVCRKQPKQMRHIRDILSSCFSLSATYFLS